MNVCIFDDEPMALDYLHHQLNKFSNINVIFKSTEPLINLNKHLWDDIDIVFLDIEMPETNGLALAEQITAYNPHIIIVFVTAHKQYAIEAFEMHALDYLLKPVSVKRLNKTIQRINSINSRSENDRINSTSTLHINVFDDLTFRLSNSSYLESIKWRTSKSKELFLYLLHNEGKLVLKSELVEALWEEIDVDKAFAYLYVSIYHIRQSLSSLQDYIKILNIEDGYQLQLQHVQLDKKEWKKQLLEAPDINIHTIETYEEIMQLYKGNYLEKFDYLWIQGEKFELEELWIRHAKLMADCYRAHNHIEKAISWYANIIKIRPEDEGTAFHLMTLYATLNYRMFVDYQYKQLYKSMAELDLTVNSEITTWYTNWKKNIK
ncbi:response regulator [Gracilibacillus sp. S3-1-1]|uniref:Response regulator n=1 Tax=Gracilibacillus pellucidus TaxID=3095368 RepID=A0ACC6M3J2_9BACI|nr:response regulator [Gracilibacillus sp. S3-1-1]MDX8045506.1 response regulator [Gracilibacillus sp. S3-1-1]